MCLTRRAQPGRSQGGVPSPFLAKRCVMSRQTIPPAADWQSAPERDFLAYRLIGLAELYLDSYFADPTGTEDYQRPSRRTSGRGKGPRALASGKRDGVTLTLSPRPDHAESFQVDLRSDQFSALLRLRYLPEDMELRAARVEQFTGDIRVAITVATEWLNDESDLPEEAMLKAALEELADLPPASVAGTEGADKKTPFDPSASAPPPPTAADKRDVKALVRTVADEIRRDGAPSLEAASQRWMEDRPQSLWPLFDAAVAAGTARRRDEAVMAACRWLLAKQLELIRYRLERGHDWAQQMLDAYQEKLVALAQAKTMPEADWFELVNLLKVAKVPIRPKMSEALTVAAADAVPEMALGTTAQELSQQFRGLLDGLAGSAESPFMVVEGLAETGTLIPAEMRAYMVHELGLSPHVVLREAVPLLMLDPEPAVREAAIAVLEQVAGPETISPVMLRRILLLRNWVPEAEREAIDRLVRKARLKGVNCAQWTPAPPLAIQSSIIDGSGAQSLIVTTPKGRTGLFAGLLLKQSLGIRDAWCNPSLARREIDEALDECRQRMPTAATGRDYLDLMVQHHIARGVAMGTLPQVAVVEIAETIGAADWKDRGLDVAAEIERRFTDLAAEQRGSDAIAASLQRSGAWVAKNPMVESWFEDDAAIRPLAGGTARLNPQVGVQRVLEEILPARREIWAERLLLTTLWLQTGSGDASPADNERWQDCAVLAHELLAGRKMAELPAMVAIAERSIAVARANRW